MFVISNLTDSLKRKKVLESIETMQNEYIGISCCVEELPETFKAINGIDELKKAYKETYRSLLSICENYEPEDVDESYEDYYSEPQ